MNAAPPTSHRFRRVLTTPLAWVFFMVVAFTTTTAAYSLPDAAAIAVLYGLFALALVGAVRALGAVGLAGRLAGAAVAGLVLAWHLREQTRVEGTGPTLWTGEGLLQFLPIVALISGAVLLLEVLRGRGHEHELRRQLVIGLLGTVAFLVTLAGVFHGTATARWHLLRHNRMIGAVAFHAFATPVERIEAERWAAHRNGAPLGQPTWVLELYGLGHEAGESTAPGASAAVPDAAGSDEDRVDADPVGPPDENAGAAAGQGAATPPDIVFVMLDTLRADALAAYGGDPELMPALNDLAAGATLFTDVIANAPWTQPSVASMFTGVHAEEHGVISYDYRLSASVVTLAEVLRAQGYRTAAFVANAVIVNPDSGFVRGFDTFEYIDDTARTYARADTVTDHVAGWLRSNLEAGAAPDPGDDRRPLFLYVHYLDPHVPYLSSGLGAAQQASPTIAEARRYYGDELRFLDRELARLVGTLDRQLPGAALFVTSDHGEEFGEHDGLGHSQTLYSEVLRIPAALRLPAAAPLMPFRIDTPLEGRDFFDLLVRLGAGEDLEPAAWAADNAREARVASLYFEKDPGRSQLVHYLLRPYRSRIFNRMIERDGWRYVFSAFGPTDELYDLSADPGEIHNLAGAEPARLEALRAELEETPPYWVQLVPLQLSGQALERLRQLGYIR